MTWPKSRAIVILFMALAMALAIGGQTIALWPIGSQTMVSRPMALAIWKAKPLPCRLISFISMVISLKTVEAVETTALEGSQGGNKIEYKSEKLREPFQEEKIETKEQPQVQIETGPLPTLQIQGIVWGGSIPQAIINSKVFRVGDTIEGVRITDINKKGVTVFFGNRQYNLTTSSPISSQGPKKESIKE